MKLRRRDQSRATAAVSLVTGLPPGVVLRADDLEDVAPPEGHRRVLAGDGGILVGVVVEERPDEQLEERKQPVTKENAPCVPSPRILAADIWSFVMVSFFSIDHDRRRFALIPFACFQL